METRTERALQLALAALLDKVRTSETSWSKGAFQNAANHVANVSPSEAGRFQTALVELNYLTPGSNKKTLKPNFDANYWSNPDAMLGFVKEILSIADIVRVPGPKKGSHRTVPTLTLSEIADDALIEELRSRGWTVKCFKEITQVIEL